MNKIKYPLLMLSFLGLLSACGTSSADDGSNSKVVDSDSESISEGGSDEDESISYVPTEDKEVTVVKKAASYKDLPVWNKYDKDHWKVISPYKGKRDDFRDESIYFAMTTRFYDGDKNNNARCWDGKNNADSDPEWRGDFKGLIQKMDYIKAQGFTAIWITPVVQNASGYDYHGYHAHNFKKVDYRYESEDVKFIDVIKEAHKRDMKIVLDIVLNHTCNFGEENLLPIFTKDSKDTSINGMIPNTTNGLLPANYSKLNGNDQFQARVAAINRDDKDIQKMYHHDTSPMSWESYNEQTANMTGDCQDLNTENPTVVNYLVEAYGEFIRMGVDAFRIDTMKHISRLTFNNYFFPAFKQYAEKCGNKNFFMFGEVCTRVREVWNRNQACDSTPFYTWKESKNYSWGDTETNKKSVAQNWTDNSTVDKQPRSQNAYLGDRYKYHTPDHTKWSGSGVIDFPMHWNFNYASDAYNLAVSTDNVYNDSTYNVMYVDSHDYAPDGNPSDKRYNQGTNAWKENMSLLFTFRGIPCIYYGSEIEFQKGKTIDEGPNIALKDSGRAYFGDNIEGSVTVNDFGSYKSASGKMSNTLSATLSKHLQMLNKIRLKVPALRRGQYTSIDTFNFVRRYTVSNSDSVAVVSISQGRTFSGLPEGTYVDLVSGDKKTISEGGSITTSVSGQGNLAVYVLDNGASGPKGSLGKIN